MRYLLKNARLLPYLTEGYAGDRADILIENGKISRIMQPGTDTEMTDTIDVSGKTVLPGMFDLHMHLYFYTTDFNKLAVESRDPNMVTLRAVEAAREYLAQGFTTIRDVGNPYYVGLLVREGTAQGLFQGPRVFSAGQCITPTARGNDTFAELYSEANTPGDLVKVCRDQCAHGVDLLKYMGTGSVGGVKGIPGALITTEEELGTVQRVAEEQGVPVAVHCHGKSGIMLCASLGIRTIEHASDIDEECTDLILKKGGKSCIVPTLGPIGLMQEGLLVDAVSKKFEPEKNGQNRIHPMVKASRAGVLTGWGTDVSLDYYSSHVGSEFILRKMRGYTNQEMLMQATINSAKILGVEDKLGTIAEGKLADLLVVDGDPDQDITVMTRRPEAVYKEGVRCF